MQVESSLPEQLADLSAGFRQRAAPGRVALMETATADLRATGIEQWALKVGATAPRLSLPDATGQMVSLADLWQQGPLLVHFYRGTWCPYCNVTLRHWQQRMAQLAQRGARMVAISPQTPDASLSMAEKNELAFPVLSDSALQAAEAFGIRFDMAPAVVEQYRGMGVDLPVLNGNGRWSLPVPATYVIDPEGRIAYSHVEVDYRQRAEPHAVMLAVDRLRDEAAMGT